ncbi:MAG: Adenylosuccinate lyase PurB [Candidatus Methanohalarchaeum thermophilum]|uniref:Adenylosuccinate lyase n=1 Tax=Methanohalarchaeum thermophilum TaxID=1903181 RepID=A0A1Q6DUH1_METT1|nr:MAG: Adenylosuccinate lyase PurB [Candidatus Methanohalarchaeum thermophilum]
MREIWEKESELKKMLDVEAALAEAEAELGLIPKEAAEEISKKANLEHVDLKRVKEIEREIHHDIMAVVEGLSEQCIKDYGEYVHLGATSNDIKDTARGLQIKESLKIIEERLLKLEDTLLEKCDKYSDLVCVGRTHGQHAVPTTLGHKLAIYANELRRHHNRLNELKERVLVGQITGAVGTQAALGEKGEEVHKKTIKKLGLNPVVISNQVIQRDRHAEMISKLSLISSTLDKIGREIRNLQRTEISEVEEPFREGQVGSSTMPQKRNPIRSERICGLAKVVRGNIQTELENIPLEHERDLTNSSAERIVIPETLLLVDEQLKLAENVMNDLVVHKDNIQEVLDLTEGLNMSEALMIKLVKKGLGRQKAHKLVKECAMEAYRSDKKFYKVLNNKSDIKEYLSEEEIKNCLDPSKYLGCSKKHIKNVLDISRRERGR